MTRPAPANEAPSGLHSTSPEEKTPQEQRPQGEAVKPAKTPFRPAFALTGLSIAAVLTFFNARLAWETNNPLLAMVLLAVIPIIVIACLEAASLAQAWRDAKPGSQA